MLVHARRSKCKAPHGALFKNAFFLSAAPSRPHKMRFMTKTLLYFTSKIGNQKIGLHMGSHGGLVKAHVVVLKNTPRTSLKHP